MADYFFATDLKGFRSASGDAISTLRVRVTERRDGYVWCRTADIQHAGCPLVLRDEQVREVAR
jgi:hypothetical protein